MIKIYFACLAAFLVCSTVHADNSKHSDYPMVKAEDQEQAQSNNPLPSPLVDIETMMQDFILETKKIEFSKYPNAFNPSLIRWRGRLLMSFRIYNPINYSTNPFALVWLDESFNPIGEPQVFELPFHNPILPSKQQDPRLIAVGERLFIVYNNILENVTTREIRRMFLAELFYDGENFTASMPECLVNYKDKNDMRYEKNWVPFEYEGELLLSYSLIPHHILRPILGTGACETVEISASNIQWNWGVPRGGTQALFDKDHYLAFFHSWIDLPTVQSNGKKISHYFMGAYTFQAHPPFAITAFSPQPIVAENFYQPPYYKTWKPLRCVFPAGIIIDENYIWISYGRQDHEIWIVKLDKKGLTESLIPVLKK